MKPSDLDLLTVLQTPVNIPNSVFVAPNATTIGRVHLSENCNIWFGAVLRGDTDQILVGERSNIQDNAVLHADPGDPCSIGHDCVIGHSAVVHGAKLEHHVLIGMNATVLNNAEIGEFSIVGANALVPAGMKVPPYSLVMGVPAKVVKSLDPEKVETMIQNNVDEYVQRARIFKEALQKKTAEIKAN